MAVKIRAKKAFFSSDSAREIMPRIVIVRIAMQNRSPKT